MSRYTDDREEGDVARGPGIPSFATASYYQGLSQDERQYGQEAEYRQQFYNFIEQLHQQLYDAVANGDKIINRGDLYQPYPDNPQLQAEVNEFFDTLFPSNGSALVENILSSDLFAGAVREYNRAPGNFDFAANWDSLSSPSQLQEQAVEAEEEVSLDVDPDLTGTVQVFEEGVPYILNLPEMDRPPIFEADVLPIEITEPEVTFEELEREEAGGGGAEAAPAEETAPAEEEAAAEEEPLSTVEVPAGQPSPVVDLQHQWVYVGNGTFRNIVTGEEITIFIDPDFEDPYEEGRVYSRGDEIPATDVSPEQEEPEEEPSLIEEIFTISMPASDMVNVIMDDTVTPAAEQPAEIPTTPATPAETVVDTPVETPAQGQEQAGEAGQAGTDTGQVGEGQDGADGGEGGLGGLGGLGMFAGLGEPPGEFTQPEPFKRVSLGYRPVQMERARLFDYMDYNPLRNIR